MKDLIEIIDLWLKDIATNGEHEYCMIRVESMQAFKKLLVLEAKED